MRVGEPADLVLPYPISFIAFPSFFHHPCSLCPGIALTFPFSHYPLECVSESQNFYFPTLVLSSLSLSSFITLARSVLASISGSYSAIILVNFNVCRLVRLVTYPLSCGLCHLSQILPHTNTVLASAICLLLREAFFPSIPLSLFHLPVSVYP